MMKRNPESLSVGLVFDDSLDSNDGVAQHVKAVGAWLSSQGHQVRYLVGETKIKDWAGGRVYSLAKNQAVSFNGNKLSIPRPANKNKIKQVLEAEKFDVLHVMVPYSPFLAQKIINLASPSTVVVGTFHVYPSSFLSRFGSRLLRLLYGRSLRRFSAIVSVSPAAAAFAKEAYGLSTAVVPNPIDIKSFTDPEPPTDRDRAKRIVFLGRLVKRKGCRQLIEAFGLLDSSVPSRLIIAGDGPHRPRLERLVRNLGIEDRVEFLGFIDEANKPGLLASADIACFPSLYGEAFGIVLIEAMASGSKVVLAGDNPGYGSVLGDQPQLLVDPLDKAAFASRLQRLLTDQPAIDAIHKWQQAEVKQYDINVVGRQVLELYDEAIARLSKKSHNKAHE